MLFCFVPPPVIVTVEAINKSLDKDNPEETHQLIQKNEAMLPKVFKRSAYLYHSGLKKEKDKKQGDLVHEDMVQTVTGSNSFLYFLST